MPTINEGSSAIYTASITDPAGNPVTSFNEAVLTLYDEYTGNIINSRHDQNILNTNNVTISGGTLTWQMQPEDNLIVNIGRRGEWHIALFVFTWTVGRHTHRTRFKIVNYAHEPASEL